MDYHPVGGGGGGYQYSYAWPFARVRLYLTFRMIARLVIAIIAIIWKPGLTLNLSLSQRSLSFRSLRSLDSSVLMIATIAEAIIWKLVFTY